MSTTSEEFFEAKYRRAADPWRFVTDPYERARYAAILRAVGDGPFRSAFEPGCSVGELTVLLAPRCERLLATEISATAVARASERCSQLDHVAVVHADVGVDLPDETFDLVVFSEIGYYFGRARLDRLVRDVVHRLEPGGRLVAAHWTGHSDDHVLDGPTVHDVIDDVGSLTAVLATTDPGYVLGAWTRSEN